ncbi:ammonium transporter [Enterococcus ratti]|uniref:Ammonium transporter n=1 Tax=Enterococcus ratti TaxID=150033 RepID=A0A1L8WNU7_9ENTE|nr:ammonium transporter [Enterococcus ratti]OJG82700.1 ammonium transporter [Enterococcus ratti]
MTQVVLNNGDTAFMMLCTAMVCLMTPGLAFFYGGLARKRSILIIMMQSFISMGIVTLIWIFGGFGLAFGQDHGGIIGNIKDYFALANVDLNPNILHGATIPFALFFAFQLMFCVITVPLMTGAFAERLNIKGYLLLLIFWTILIYLPVCHWVWGNGFLEKMGFVDFAGGAVIHTTAGFGALASIFVLGNRTLKKKGMQPNNLMAAAIGTGLLWFGWFGFNSGGALGANYLASTAFINTIVGLASAMVTWMIFAYIQTGKINFLDILTGSVAGLATITPCSGYIKPTSAILVGIVAGIICNVAVKFRENRGWDDALDVWGVHGIGGFTGTILIGFFAASNVNKVSASMTQLGVQVGGVIFIALYSFILTYVMLRLFKRFFNIEPTNQEIDKGLDEYLLAEKAYME